MSEENNKKEREQVEKGKSRKNVCKICGKKIFDTNKQTTMCINLKSGGSICLSCGYEIEFAIEAAEYGDYYNDNYDDYENVNSVPEIKPAETVPIQKIEEKIISNLPSRKVVIDKLKKSIIGQDRTIEMIVGMVYRNLLSKNKLLKSAPLLIGKSGQGKTEIVTAFCKLINVPYVVENAKDFSEVGYVGRNPSEIFGDLYNACGKNKKLTEMGVIVIDEIDKLMQAEGVSKDVSGSGVVNTFLSYLSGVKQPIKDRYDAIIDYVDTTGITFIFMGAFEDDNLSDSLYKIREKRLGKDKHIGFSTSVSKIEKDLQKFFIAEDLMQYGFSRQFVGRVAMIELNELTLENYKDIMFKSEISVYNAYIQEFCEHGIEVVCSQILLDEIVKKAMQKQTGARGIRTVCDEVFLKALEEIEVNEELTYSKVIFNDDVIENPESYTLK